MCFSILFFPKTPPELGSRLDFGVQGLAGGSLGKFRGVIQFGMLFARFLSYAALDAFTVANKSASFCIVICNEMEQSGQ